MHLINFLCYYIIVRLKMMIMNVFMHLKAILQQTWGQVHQYLYLSTFKYTFQSTCTLLKYFLISAGVLVLTPKYYVEYLYVLGYL